MRGVSQGAYSLECTEAGSDDTSVESEEQKVEISGQHSLNFNGEHKIAYLPKKFLSGN